MEQMERWVDVLVAAHNLILSSDMAQSEIADDLEDVIREMELHIPESE